MTAINGVAGTAGSFTARGVQTPQPDPMNEVAKLLGMTPAEIKTQVQTGRTLSELANDRNVSGSDLVAAVQAGAAPDAPTGLDGSTQAERIAYARDLPPPQQAQAAGSDRGFQGLLARTSSAEELTAIQRTKLDNLSAVLQMETPLLLSKLADGMDLFTLAQQQGIGVQALGNFLEDGDLVDVLL